MLEVLLGILCLVVILMVAGIGLLLKQLKQVPEPLEPIKLPNESFTPPEATPLPDSTALRERLAIELSQAEKAGRANLEERMQSLAVECIARLPVSNIGSISTDTVAIETEDLKGRIVGKDGKNIRAFEAATGVDLLVDERPGFVILSCFDPLRRAVAKLALERLLAEGRIQPSRIEEVCAEAKRDVEKRVEESGRLAAKEAGVDGISPRILGALGTLSLRTSLGQNVLTHSIETSQLCKMLAHELKLDVKVASIAGLLHDIGKGLGPEFDGPHALAGMRFLQQNGIKEPVLNAVGAHHREILPATPEAEIVIFADALSASRPGARSEPLDAFLKRMETIESIAKENPSVREVFAVKNGHEVRVLVAPDLLDDLGCRELADSLARRYELEGLAPGDCQVTVIREYRAVANIQPN